MSNFVEKTHYFINSTCFITSINVKTNVMIKIDSNTKYNLHTSFFTFISSLNIPFIININVNPTKIILMKNKGMKDEFILSTARKILEIKDTEKIADKTLPTIPPTLLFKPFVLLIKS